MYNSHFPQPWLANCTNRYSENISFASNFKQKKKILHKKYYKKERLKKYLFIFEWINANAFCVPSNPYKFSLNCINILYGKTNIYIKIKQNISFRTFHNCVNTYTLYIIHYTLYNSVQTTYNIKNINKNFAKKVPPKFNLKI